MLSGGGAGAQAGVTAGAGAAGVAVAAAHALHEKLLKRLPELPGHAAVDAKVERIAEADAQVDYEDGRLHEFIVQEVDDGRGHGVQDSDDSHG